MKLFRSLRGFGEGGTGGSLSCGRGRSTGPTGHRSVAMVRVYTRADAFADHAGEGLL